MPLCFERALTAVLKAIEGDVDQIFVQEQVLTLLVDQLCIFLIGSRFVVSNSLLET